MNIAKVSEIMAWENQNLGFLSRGGFVVPPKIDTSTLGECVVLGDADLTEDEAIDWDALQEVRFDLGL